MRFFFCPYLGTNVELTDEREQHIVETHPGTLPDYFDQLAETLADPDQVRQSDKPPARYANATSLPFYSPNTLLTFGQGGIWLRLLLANVTVYTDRQIVGGKVIRTKT